MDEYIAKYLFDILSTIEEIESFLGERPKLFREFQTNMMLHKAIERNIEIIGEASNRILKIDANFPLKDAHQAVQARNFVAHGYDKVDDNILWGIVINDLPKLKKEVSALLAEDDTE